MPSFSPIDREVLDGGGAPSLQGNKEKPAKESDGRRRWLPQAAKGIRYDGKYTTMEPASPTVVFAKFGELVFVII